MIIDGFGEVVHEGAIPTLINGDGGIGVVRGRSERCTVQSAGGCEGRYGCEYSQGHNGEPQCKDKEKIDCLVTDHCERKNEQFA